MSSYIEENHMPFYTVVSLVFCITVIQGLMSWKDAHTYRFIAVVDE